MEKTREVFISNLRNLRNDRGWSQAKTAEKVEISLSGYAQIEYGKVWPAPKTIDAIAKALGVSQARLFQDAATVPMVQSEMTVDALAEAIAARLPSPVGVASLKNDSTKKSKSHDELLSLIADLNDDQIGGILKLLRRKVSDHKKRTRAG